MQITKRYILLFFLFFRKWKTLLFLWQMKWWVWVCIHPVMSVCFSSIDLGGSGSLTLLVWCVLTLCKSIWQPTEWSRLVFRRGDDICSDPTFTFLPSSFSIYQLFLGSSLTFADDVSKHCYWFGISSWQYFIFSKVVAEKSPAFSVSLKKMYLL